MKTCRLAAASIVALAIGAGVASAQGTPSDAVSQEEGRERNLRAYVELLRSDIRTQKVAVVTEMMEFTDAEDAAFWPVYRQFEVDAARLNDERLRLIETYATSYSKMTGTIADELAVKSLDLEARRAALKQKYYAQLKVVLPPLVAAKALQVENQLQLVIDLQIASHLPVVQ